MEALSTGPGVAQQTKQSGFLSYLKGKYVDVHPTGALRWWLTALIVWAWTIEQFEAQRVGPVLVYVLDDFHKTMTQWGEVLALCGIAYGVGSLVLSRLADRFGRRPMMVWPVVVYCGLTTIAALAPSFQVLACMAILGNFSVAGMSPAVLAASRDITPRLGRAMAYSWVSLAYTAGALLSTFVAAQTLGRFPGWRPQFWIGAGFALITAIVLFVFYRDLSPNVRSQALSRDRQGHDATQAEASSVPAPGRSKAYDDGSLVYRSPRLWLLGATLIFWAPAYVTVTNYVPTYLAQHFHMEPARAAGVTSCFWLSFTASVMLSGWLSDRLEVRKPITAFGGVTTALCFFVSARMPADASVVSVILIWALTGVCAGFIYPAWCAAYSETAEQVSPFGVARAFGISGILSPLAIVFLNLGLPRVVAAHGWPAWMTVAGCSCLCCATLICFARGPWWRRSTPASSSRLVEA